MAELQIPEINEIRDTLQTILQRLDELDSRSIPEWITLPEATKLKGLSYDTLKKHREWQPDPAEARLINGKRRWPREVIIAWLKMTDEDCLCQTK